MALATRLAPVAIVVIVALTDRRRITYAPLISVLKMVWPWIVVQMLSSVSRPTQKPANKRAADEEHHRYSDNRLLGI